MFRLDNTLERWATAYKAIAHDPAANSKHRTFFRMSSVDDNSFFARNYATQPSPSMGYVTHVDGEMDRTMKSASYRHVIFFFIKSDQKNLDPVEMKATDARYYGDELVQAVLAFLDRMQSAANNGKQEVKVRNTTFYITADERQGWRGLQLDSANWATIPSKYDGWQIMGLAINQMVPRQLCIIDENYE